jgi:beta-lactamase regulating signal transducer with metallopeptidase domain
MEVTAQEQVRLTLISRMLWFVILVFGLGFLVLAFYPDASQQKNAKIEVTTDSQALADDTQKPTSSSLSDTPLWMVGILVGCTVLQVGAVARAASVASKPRLSSLDIKHIELLSETPMYLGLLGSLVGVCLTQFISASLSAPLAYLTTIGGILMHLFARFYVALKPSVFEE